MAYTLREILPLLVLPVGLTIAFLILGLWLRRRALITLALALFWLSSTPLVSGELMTALESSGGRLVAARMPTADAIVVLSTGRSQAPGPERVSEWVDADRFFGGVELMTAQRAPHIVFTGGVSSTQPLSPLEGEILRTYASAFGLPDSTILVKAAVNNTEEEAAAVSDLLRSRRHGRPRVLLVTSAFHMQRAMSLFERKGIDVVPFPVDFRGRYEEVRFAYFVPSARALERTELALRELYGRVLYRVL